VHNPRDENLEKEYSEYYLQCTIVAGSGNGIHAAGYAESQ